MLFRATSTGIAWLAFAFLTLTNPASGQSPIAGFPPGTFSNRAAIDAAPVASFTGSGDIVANATFAFSLRAYSLAKAGTKIANICNSGDANCADINSTATGDFDTATAQGAPLNCGGAGGTCTIKTWYDQIGSNCTAAACDVTNAVAANRPTLVFSCTGGKVCARFSLASSQVLDATNVTTTTIQPNSVVAVGLRNGSPGNFGSIVSFTTTNNLLGATNSASQWRLNFGNDILVTAADSTWHTSAGVVNGASSNFYVDNGSNAGNAGTSVFTFNLKVGAVATQFWNGDIVEVVGYTTDLSSGVSCGSQAACVSALNTNQKAYWGF